MSGAIDLPVISKFDPTGLKQAQSALGGFQSSLGKIAGAVAAAFSVGAIVNFAKNAFMAAEEAQAVNNVLVQVAKNTLPVTANLEAATDRMIKFADSQEVLLGIDGEIIKSTQAKLLGFSSLASSANQVGGVFDRSLSASFDLAAVSGKDVGAMSLALGKALEDPLSALGGIARGTVKFSESQQELIKKLVASGDLLGAQDVILSTVENKFGGAAEAAAKGSARMALALENLMETAGEPLLGVFADLVTGMAPVLDLVGQELGKAFTNLGPTLTQIVSLLPSLIQSFMPLIPIIGELVGLFLEMVAAALPLFVDLFNQLLPIIQELAPIIADALMVAFEALMPVFMTLIEALMPIVEALLPVLAELIVAIAPIIVRLVEAFMPLIDLVMPILIGLIELLIPILTVVAEILAVMLTEAIGWLTRSFQDFMEFLAPFTQAFEGAFGGIKEFFFTVVNNMIGLWEGFANTVINAVNFVIRALNRIQVSAPKWLTDLTGITSFGINIQELPNIKLPRVALAEGGIVTGPLNALIGEAGPEAVIPLDKMPKGNTYNITVNAGIGTNGAQVGEAIINAIRRYERASGPVFARA